MEGNSNSKSRSCRDMSTVEHLLPIGQSKVSIDLAKLRAGHGPEHLLLRRFLGMIRQQRQDFNGRVITIRATDLQVIACNFGVTPDAMEWRLEELTLRLASPED